MLGSPKMKLNVELVPKKAWNKSLSELLPRKVWNGIRESIIRDNGKKCQICGDTEGIMSLHEIWNYDDVTHIQKLDGFILLCSLCHHVKHIGLAGILAKQGKLDFNKVINHFCSVNGCSEKEYREHVKNAFAIWRERSLFQWKQDFGEYEKFLQK
jgi:5-methylcytosine-specific restriction endonuclease McrA